MAQGDKHHIDELLRAKLSAPSSDVKSDWNAFSAKLAIAQKRKRRKRIWVAVSSVIALLLIVGLFGTDYLMPNKALPTTNPTIESPQPITDTPIENNEGIEDISVPDIDYEKVRDEQIVDTEPPTEEPTPDILPESTIAVENQNTDQPIINQTEGTITENNGIELSVNEGVERIETNTESDEADENIKLTINKPTEDIANENTAVKEPANNTSDEESDKPDVVLEETLSNTDKSVSNENQSDSGNTFSDSTTTQLANNDSSNAIIDSTTNTTSTEKPNIKLSPKTTKWIFSFNAYSNYTVRDVKIKDNSTIHKDYENILSNSEEAGYSTNFGFEVRYRPLPFLTIGSGIHYTQNRTVGNFDFTNDQVPVIDVSGAIVGYITLDSTQVRTVSQSINNRQNYVEIPFLLTYEKQLSEKWYLNTEFGASVLFHLNSKGETINSFSLEATQLSNQPSRTSLGTLHARAGLLYNFSNNWFVGIEPTYKYYLGSIYETDSPIKINQYTIGLNMSIQYRIK